MNEQKVSAPIPTEPVAWRVKYGVDWIYFEERPNWLYENGMEIDPLYTLGVGAVQVPPNWRELVGEPAPTVAPANPALQPPAAGVIPSDGGQQ